MVWKRIRPAVLGPFHGAGVIIGSGGGTVLFVGTKKQARDAVKDAAELSGQPYVNHRWLGGLLTNFQTINQRIKRLHDLERFETEGQLALLPTRERLSAQADLEKLRANLGGATVFASCTPPSCNIGVLPGLPIYASDGLLPNGTTGWVRSRDVSTTRLHARIVVDIRTV